MPDLTVTTSLLQPRIIPGAPPSIEEQKSSKRRRKPKNAGTDGAASAAEGTPVPPTPKVLEPEERTSSSFLKVEQPAVSLTSPTSALPDDDALLSPIVGLVSKRLKATTKKIIRISGYAAADPDTLNEDQKRLIQTLPTLDAIQKELSEVKKTIETYEANLATELAAKRVEAERAEAARIKNAIDSTKADIITRASDMLGLLRLHSAFASGAFEGAAFFADDLERGVIYSITRALLDEDASRKEAALNGLLSGPDNTDSFDGVSFTRIKEIVQALLAPPRAPTPTQGSPLEASQHGVSEPEGPTPGLEASGISGSFHFMQESELEPEGNLEESADWVGVEKPEIDLTPPAESANGHAQPQQASFTTAAGAGGSTLDWSAEGEGDNELPPIESLGPSGSATPAEAPEAQADDDGFVSQHHGHNRSGRGGRGYRRGGERGEHRGEHRGGRGGHFRGGERGRGERGPRRGSPNGEQGQGGERPERRERGERGDRPEGSGHRGGFRGGERGGFRGGRGGASSAEGGWRNEGGGRGGRGRGPRGGGPAAPAQPAAQA